MINWISRNKNNIIQNAFLLPILLVVIMSISHVVSWYDIGNPLSWAIYLSIAIEVFALASVSASTININRGSIWALFILVTFIQILGNIYFEYLEIDTNSHNFLAWVELIQPLFYGFDLTDHRRVLAAIQGGTLPIMSLTALHYYIKFNDINIDSGKISDDIEELIEDDVKVSKDVPDVPIDDKNDHTSKEIDGNTGRLKKK